MCKNFNSLGNNTEGCCSFYDGDVFGFNRSIRKEILVDTKENRKIGC